MEITEWPKILASQPGCLDAIKNESGQDPLKLLRALNPLRLAAIHRFPTPGRAVVQMLKCAVRVVRMLQDEVRTMKLEAIISDFQDSQRDMKIHKHQLEDQLFLQLQSIRSQRAALDRAEVEAKENMFKQNLERTKSISSTFEKFLDNLIQGETLRMDRREAEPDTHNLDQNTNNDVKVTALRCH